jgi:hypothetical protein
MTSCSAKRQPATYALEWTDDNRLSQEIVAEACDEEDRCVRDRVQLKPLEILEQSQYRACCWKPAFRTGQGITSVGSR